MARALVADLRRIDRALVENRARCAAAVAASDTTLTAIVGISDVLAAKILGHVGDVRRFGSADRFASYTGTAPIEVSSGEVTRHRLSRSGNRSLNNALHLAARVQTMHPGPGRDHYDRKLAEDAPLAKRCAASSASWRRSSTAISSPIAPIVSLSPLDIEARRRTPVNPLYTTGHMAYTMCDTVVCDSVSRLARGDDTAAGGPRAAGLSGPTFARVVAHNPKAFLRWPSTVDAGVVSGIAISSTQPG